MENRLEDKAAPSGLLPICAGICCCMIEFKGRARPRMPSNPYDKGSSLTDEAAPSAWLVILYPPTWTASHTMGPLTDPSRYWMVKFLPVEVEEELGSYNRPLVDEHELVEQDFDATQRSDEPVSTWREKFCREVPICTGTLYATA